MIVLVAFDSHPLDCNRKLMEFGTNVTTEIKIWLLGPEGCGAGGTHMAWSISRVPEMPANSLHNALWVSAGPGTTPICDDPMGATKTT